jgi:hypothetical protein
MNDPLDTPPKKNVSNSGWVRRVVNSTWHSFIAKFIAAIGLLAALAGLTTFALGQTMTTQVRLAGMVVSFLLLGGLTLFYGGRALVRLAKEGETLAKELDEAWKQVNSLNDEKKQWESNAEVPSRLCRLASAVFGFVYYDHRVECHLSRDGAFDILTTLKMAAKIDGVESIEHMVSAPHAPENWDDVIDLTATDKDDQSVRLTYQVLDRSAKTLYWLFRALPELPKGHRIEYSYSERLPADSFAMDKSKMQSRNLEWEYFAVRISYPTERLQFTVDLPAGFVPEHRAYDIWFGTRNKVRHVQEHVRVTESEFWHTARNSKSDQLQLRLNVDSPIQGLYYVIKWIPP